MKYFISILLFLLTTNIFAMNCSSVADIKQFNGHYYTVTIDKLTFEEAKQIAKNNGGYLAIPNSASENNFIKSVIGGGSSAWIGIYDPNKITNYCYDDVSCAYDDSRFKDINNASLLYKNWGENEPDNLVKHYDVIAGINQVSPLGENWVAINGNNGLWGDYGNHKDEYNNPVKFKAIFEFDTAPDCVKTSDIETELTSKVCNTKIWDETVDVVTPSKTVDCLTDVHGVDYCPEALASAREYWDYDAGYSVMQTQTVIDYANKIQTVDYQNPTTITGCSNGAYDPISGRCIYNGIYQIVLNRQPDSGGYNFWKTFFSNPPTYANILEFVRTAAARNAPYLCGSDPKMKTTRGQEIVAAYVWYLGRCPEPGGSDGYFALPEFDMNIFFNAATAECNARGHCPYTPPLVYTSNPYTINECSFGYDYNDQLNKCQNIIYACPPGYMDNGSNCKKDKTYTYYEYFCKNEKNKYNQNWQISDSGGDKGADASYSASPPTNNCRRKEFTCDSTQREPAWVNNQWQCSPFPCLGESNFEDLDANVGASDSNNNGWNENGGCDGQIYLFAGKAKKCRNWDMFFGLAGGGCCDKDKVFFGLVECKANEKELAEKNKAGLCHEVGEFCSKKLKLLFTKICIEKSKGHCCFNSRLARILNEQGRPQIGRAWGSGDNPDCKGFTPEEFQKLDMSKMDLTEFTNSISIPDVTNIGSSIQNQVQTHLDNI